MEEITIKNIRNEIYESYLDTEYREALAHSLIALGYVSDTPFNLYFGTPEQKKKLEEVENRPLDSDQISEIIHLMMYEMRNDFQYGKFKPIALKFLDISEKIKNTNQKTNTRKEKPKCNIYNAHGNMIEIMGLTSKVLKKNHMFDKSREMIERATTSYSYDDAFNIINEYVETIDKSREQENEEEFEGE